MPAVVSDAKTCPTVPPAPRAAGRARRAALAAALVSIVLAGAAADAADRLPIAAEDDWPPFSSVDPATREARGFAVDIVREALAARGIEAEFVVVPFSRCMFLAERGTVAGCFNATIIDSNRERYRWHPTPLFTEELAIFGRLADRPAAALSLDDLKGRRVGYTIGYTYPSSFQDSREIERVGAKSDALLLDMLAAGRVDHVLMNFVPAMLRINANPRWRGKLGKVGHVSDDGFWLAISKRHPQGERLAQEIELGLQAIKRSGREAALRDKLKRDVGY